jgi:hypothetical protein
MVKNQQGLAAEAFHIGRSEGLTLFISPQSRDDSSSAVFHIPRPARKLRLRRPRFAGFAAEGGAGRVLHRDCEKSAGFGSGSVANQSG